MKAKPKATDNSWLGIIGETTAQLVGAKGRVLGTCLDTPNCVAYAMAINPKVLKAVGLFGTRKRADLQDRFGWVTRDAKLFDNAIKWT